MVEVIGVLAKKEYLHYSVEIAVLYFVVFCVIICWNTYRILQMTDAYDIKCKPNPQHSHFPVYDISKTICKP